MSLQIRRLAFLRAINVGGHVVKMDVLRSLFEGLGLENVQTFIASGNMIFQTGEKNMRALEQRIERALAAALGYEVSTFIRTPAEVRAIASHQPFPPETLASARALSVGLLKEPLQDSTQRALMRLRTDIDDFHTHGTELYWICKGKQSESKISNAVFERALKVKATFRGMRTLERLAAKYPA